MKRGELAVVLAGLFIALSAFASAAQCELDVKLLNQDPYPAVPDDYVKVVFQINGTDNPECGKVSFDVIQQYPFSLDSNASKVVVDGGTFVNGYPSFLLAGYKVRVDKDALDGENKLKVSYNYNGLASSSYTEEFNIEIEDARTDFEVMIQDYVASTNTVTFAVVNVGKKDVEALTLEVPKQTNMDVRGSNRAVIGSLDSNDDTTISMSAIPKTGDIVVRLYYNDQIGVRRMVEKTITFAESFLTNGKNAKKEVSIYVYLFWGLIALIIVYNVYSYYKRKAKAREKLFMRSLK